MQGVTQKNASAAEESASAGAEVDEPRQHAAGVRTRDAGNGGSYGLRRNCQAGEMQGRDRSRPSALHLHAFD
jgi:hypothetical protein